MKRAAVALGDKLARNSAAKVDDEAREYEAAGIAYAGALRDEARVEAGLRELAAAPAVTFERGPR